MIKVNYSPRTYVNVSALPLSDPERRAFHLPFILLNSEANVRSKLCMTEISPPPNNLSESPIHASTETLHNWGRVLKLWIFVILIKTAIKIFC